MRRSELVECPEVFGSSKVLLQIVDEFRGVRNYPKGWSQVTLRKDDVRNALETAILRHLQFPINIEIERRIKDGLDVADDYFFGGWWKEDRLGKIALDKSNPDRDLEWFTVYSRALLLCLLVDGYTNARKLSSWIEVDLMPEFLGGEIEPEACQVYICIASSLSESPLIGLDEVIAQVQKARAKRPRLLLEAWLAAERRDQDAFDKAFKESLKHFVSRHNKESGHITDWIAHHQSVIATLAKRNGLSLPKLPEKQAAFLISRESLDLS